MQIATKYTIDVIECDPIYNTGFYYPMNKTRVIVIAESASEAIQKAIDRTPLKKSGCAQKGEIITSEDIFVKEAENDTKI